MELKHRNSVEKKPKNYFRKAAEWVGKTARNAAFAAALPLLALASAGCESTGRQGSNVEGNVCSSYNDSTVSLNRETDGKIARISELKKNPEGEIITEPIIDFVNETHALSTEGMPPDIMLTRVPAECFDEGVAAYASLDERGAYVPTQVVFSSMRCPDIQLWVLFHEIGHFQENGAGNEVIAQLNAVEQIIMGYAVFSNQTEHPHDIIGWAVSRNASLKLEFLFHFPITDINSVNEHDRADIFVARKLLEHNGDFRAVREEAGRLINEGRLLDAVNEEVEGYYEEYYSSGNPGFGVIATDNLELRKVFFRELERRFGKDTAMAYLNATSYNARISADAETMDNIAIGLEGMSCMPAPPFGVENGPLEMEGCSVLGSEEGYVIEQPHVLCCIGAEEQEGEIIFRKWKVHAGGYRCKGPLRLYGQEWENVHFLSIEDKEEMEPGEVCY